MTAFVICVGSSLLSKTEDVTFSMAFLMHALWLALFYLSFLILLFAFLFHLSPCCVFLVFPPYPFACEILLQGMIHYCQLMGYLQVGTDENRVVRHEGCIEVVVK